MIGKRLGHYQLVASLGAGGMGDVYRAHDQRSKRDVALEVLPPGMLRGDEARRQLQRDVQALAALNHPHVATLLHCDRQGGIDFIVMELLEGERLDERVARGALPEADVLRIGIQLADGLHAAHTRGVLHRDLKPSNLRVDAGGDLKILDFRIARPAGSSERSLTGTTAQASGLLAGTMPYLAPELIQGNAADARSDVWGCGVVLFELATGRRPFQGSPAGLLHGILSTDPAWPHDPPLSPGLEAVLRRALEKDPGRRFASALELRDALWALAPETPVVGARPGAAAAARERSSRALWIASAVVLLALIAFAVLLLRRPH